MCVTTDALTVFDVSATFQENSKGEVKLDPPLINYPLSDAKATASSDVIEHKGSTSFRMLVCQSRTDLLLLNVQLKPKAEITLLARTECPATIVRCMDIGKNGARGVWVTRDLHTPRQNVYAFWYPDAGAATVDAIRGTVVHQLKCCVVYSVTSYDLRGETYYVRFLRRERLEF